MARVNCNYCGGRLRKEEIYLRYNKKYWCDSCLYIQKSRKMKCPSCNKRNLTFSFHIDKTTIECIKPYCPGTNLTWISYYHDHPQYPEVIGVIMNGGSEKIGFR